MGNTNILNLGLLVVFMALIYFMMIRPQKKKEKAENEMRNSLQPGDEVLTIGGIMGKVLTVNDKSVVITTGADRTKLEFTKTAIAAVLNEKPVAKKEKAAEAVEDEKTPDRSKKVTPKKLSKGE